MPILESPLYPEEKTLLAVYNKIILYTYILPSISCNSTNKINLNIIYIELLITDG